MLKQIQQTYQKPLYDPFTIFQPTKSFINTILQEQKELVEEWVRVPVLLDNNRYKLEHPKEYPFFLPTKTFIREVIKELKKEAYEILNAKSSDNGFFWILNEERHRQIIRRIRDYEFRLRGVSPDNKSSITNQDIQRAKEHPIQDYYSSGNLRRFGKTLRGLCPFHQEKTGSFYIYTDKNTFVCFGCGAKGDCIDFVGREKGLKFIEAIKFILNIK